MSNYPSEEIEDYELGSVNKINPLITAMYDLTKTQQKILSGIMSLVDQNSPIFKQLDLNPGYNVSVHVSQIKKWLNVGSSGSIYMTIKNSMVQFPNKIVMTSDKDEKFIISTIFSEISYRDGVLNATFSPQMTQYLKIKDNYTSYMLKEIVNLDTKYSIRFYELIVKERYRCKGKIFVKKKYLLRELEWVVGIFNVSRYDEKTKEIIVEEVMDKVLPWSEFNKIIKRSQYEIAKKTDMLFAFKVNRTGKGGAVDSVVLYIFAENNPEFYEIDEEAKTVTMNWDKIQEEEPSPISNMEKGPLPSSYTILPSQEQQDAITKMFFEKFGIFVEAPVRIEMFKVAEGNIDKIRGAVEYVSIINKKTPIQNLVAYVIAAIKNSYADSSPISVAAKEKRKTDFHNFEERNTDYDKLVDDYYGYSEYKTEG